MRKKLIDRTKLLLTVAELKGCSLLPVVALEVLYRVDDLTVRISVLTVRYPIMVPE
jgi:hypothetical protein